MCEKEKLKSSEADVDETGVTATSDSQHAQESDEFERERYDLGDEHLSPIDGLKINGDELEPVIVSIAASLERERKRPAASTEMRIKQAKYTQHLEQRLEELRKHIDDEQFQILLDYGWEGGYSEQRPPEHCTPAHLIQAPYGASFLALFQLQNEPAQRRAAIMEVPHGRPDQRFFIHAVKLSDEVNEYLRRRRSGYCDIEFEDNTFVEILDMVVRTHLIAPAAVDEFSEFMRVITNMAEENMNLRQAFDMARKVISDAWRKVKKRTAK